MFKKESYKTPKLINNLVLEYLVDADKGFLKSLKFLLTVKKVNRSLEALVNGYKIKEFTSEDIGLREYFQLLGYSLMAYTDAYMDSQRIGNPLENAREYAERFTGYEDMAHALKYLGLVERARGETVLFNVMVGNEIDRQPIYEIGKHIYLLSHAILEHSNNIDLKKEATKMLSYLITLQNKFSIFDFVVINIDPSKIDELKEYFTT